MIANMLSNKKLQPILTELFNRSRKIIIYLVFVTQSYFALPKSIRLNPTHYSIIKFPDKRAIQKISRYHLLDIAFKDFLKLYKKMYCRIIFCFSNK